MSAKITYLDGLRKLAKMVEDGEGMGMVVRYAQRLVKYASGMEGVRAGEDLVRLDFVVIDPMGVVGDSVVIAHQKMIK